MESLGPSDQTHDSPNSKNQNLKALDTPDPSAHEKAGGEKHNSTSFSET